MSSKINLSGGVPDDFGKQEAIDAERRQKLQKAAEQSKAAVTKAIKKATASPDKILTGQGVLDLSAEAAIESSLQKPQDDASRLAELKKERDQLVAIRADSPKNRDTQAMDSRISDLTSTIAMMTAQGYPIFQRTR